VRSGQSITDFVDKLPTQHATPEMHIGCPDTEKFLLIKRLAAHVKTIYRSQDLTLIDGVRARTSYGWWLVRASNTEAALVVRAEGSSPDALDRLVKNIESALAAAGMNWRA
jgi:phosphomannomutase